MAPRTEAPWLDLARIDLSAGVKEIKGSANHPRIMEMYRTVGRPEIKSEATSWCAAAVGTWLKESDFPIPPKATNLMAMSYETYGKRLDTFRPGAICVFYRSKLRERDWRRHVAIGVRDLGSHIECIGGNQSNAVTVAKFPKRDLVAMRWPVAATVKDLREAGSTDIEIAQQIRKVAIGVGGTAATGAVANQVSQPAAPPVVPDVSITQATEHMTAFQMFLEGCNAVAKLIGAHPWLAAGALCAIGLYFVARRLERKRVERAQLGHALSVEG